MVVLTSLYTTHSNLSTQKSAYATVTTSGGNRAWVRNIANEWQPTCIECTLPIQSACRPFRYCCFSGFLHTVDVGTIPVQDRLFPGEKIDRYCATFYIPKSSFLLLQNTACLSSVDMYDRVVLEVTRAYRKTNAIALYTRLLQLYLHPVRLKWQSHDALVKKSSSLTQTQFYCSPSSFVWMLPPLLLFL